MLKSGRPMSIHTTQMEASVTVCVLQLLCKQLKWPWHL